MSVATGKLQRRRGVSGIDLLATLERRLGITSSGLVLLVLAIVGWILARVIGSRSMFLLVYGGIIVLAVSWVLGRRKLSVEAIRSDLPARVREGQIVDVEIQLTAKRRLSTVVLEEDLHQHLGQMVRVPIPLLPSGQAVDHVYSFTPRLRGVYKVGPMTASWSDPFGLTRRTMELLEPTEIVVHPTTEMVHDRVLSREWEDPPIRPPFSKPWPSGFEFYGMRDYVSGDDPRRIVWRASARTLDPETGTGRYLVRESEQGITDRVSLILDTHDKSHSPGEVSETFENSVRAVASLGAKHIKDGFAVTVETNEYRMADQLRGAVQRIRLLDELARVQRAKTPMMTLIDRLMTSPRRDAHIVIVTPYLDDRTTTRLRLLMQRGVSLMLVMSLWEDSDPVSLHRAGVLGCNIVEIGRGIPLEGAFRKVMGAGSRR